MDSLVTVEDLEQWSRLTIDPASGQQVLDRVSGVVRRTAHQTISRVVDDVQVLIGTWGPVLHLPETPVEDVSAVEIADASGNTVALTHDSDYTWDRRGRLKRIAIVATLPRPVRSWWGGEHATVTVTYTHGYADVPDEIAAVVLRLAAASYVNPEGARSKRLDDYSVDFGPPWLTEDERKLVRNYRPVPQ